MKGVLAGSILLAAATVAAAPLPSPDRAFVNGRVWTGDPARPWATALAVGGDKLIAVGSDADISRLVTKRTEVVDLKGRFVAPGIGKRLGPSEIDPSIC